MNWVDFSIIAIVALFAVQGFGKPLFFETFDLLGFVLSFLVSLQFYGLAAKVLENFFTLPHSFANVLGFIIMWYLVEAVMFFLARTLYKLAPKIPQLPGEKFLSTIPAFLKGTIFVAIILILVAVFPIQPTLKKDVNNSKIATWILSYSYRIESPLKAAFGGFANDTLTFLTIEPKTNESVGLGFKNDKFVFDEEMEMQMIDMVNKERVSRGIPPLVYDPTLRQIARDHSADMFRNGYFAHYDLQGKDVADRALAAGIDYRVIGENLAYAPSLELAQQGLMNSPGHRANILSEDYHRIGIGIANGDEYGIMFTQVFKN